MYSARAICIAIAMPLSWLPLIADYSRFGKRARNVFGGTALGFFIGNLWLMSLGVAYTLAFAPRVKPMLCCWRWPARAWGFRCC